MYVCMCVCMMQIEFEREEEGEEELLLYVDLRRREIIRRNASSSQNRRNGWLNASCCRNRRSDVDG